MAKKLGYHFAISCAFIALFLLPSTYGEAQQNEITSSYLVKGLSSGEVRQLAQVFDLEGKQHGYPLAYIPASRLQEFFAWVPAAELYEADISQPNVVEVGEEKAEALSLYNYSKVETDLQSIAQDNPNLTALETYGQSRSGRNLYALRLGSTAEDAPRLMITGATHGNETLTVDVVMAVLKRWVQKANTDERVGAFLRHAQVYFVPVVSPDSYVAKVRLVGLVDPNRDYPWPGDPDHRSIGIIQAISNFALSKGIKGSVDIHSTAGVIMYPWAYTDHLPSQPMLDRFRDLVENMAQTNGYETGQISDVMYVAKGSSADFYFWKIGTEAVAIELGQGSVRTALDLDRQVDQMDEPLMRFVEHF